MGKRVVLKISHQGQNWDDYDEIDITEWFNKSKLSIPKSEQEEGLELLNLAIEEARLEFWVEEKQG